MQISRLTALVVDLVGVSNCERLVRDICKRLEKSKHTISDFDALIGDGLIEGLQPPSTKFLNSDSVQDTKKTNVIKIISGVFDQNFSD